MKISFNRSISNRIRSIYGKYRWNKPSNSPTTTTCCSWRRRARRASTWRRHSFSWLRRSTSCSRRANSAYKKAGTASRAATCNRTRLSCPHQPPIRSLIRDRLSASPTTITTTVAAVTTREPKKAVVKLSICLYLSLISFFHTGFCIGVNLFGLFITHCEHIDIDSTGCLFAASFFVTSLLINPVLAQRFTFI